MNPTSRYPDWLHRALGLTEPGLPVDLSTRELLPVIDTIQGGWGRARWAAGVYTTVDNAGPQTYAITGLEASEDARVILCGDILHSGGAAAGTVTLDLYDPIINVTIVLAQVAVGAGQVVAWADLGLPGLIYVPPGIAVQTTVPARAVGETYSFRWIGSSIAAGAKPI